jgi:hypothetical protein
MTKKHTIPPEDLDLRDALHEERHLFEEVEVPIVTVSATYRKELAKKYRSIVHTPSDVVYSRAHYSMAEAVRRQALEMGRTSHLSDPINFVTLKDWKKLEFTQVVGKLVARNKLLKKIKEKLSSLTREKVPIAEAARKPLLYLTATTPCPIVSMHYETGNILAGAGKTVVQAITDPHVHPQYLDALPYPNITFAAFDEETKTMLLEMAKELKKEINENQVVVTGAFIDPRINEIGKKAKVVDMKSPVNIAVTTGGLGTNLKEIKKILEGFRPLLLPPEQIRLFLYAGIHRDFRDFFENYARQNHIRIGNLDDTEARVRILYDDSIIDANENIIKYMFPWAHGVITKPSGDMAYDAAAAGCFLLFLDPWGSWEERIRDIFIKRGVGFNLKADASGEHFKKLLRSGSFERSLKNIEKLPPIFREGAKNLIEIHSSLPCRTSSGL